MDDQDDIPRPVPAGWLEALERGEADIAAGRIVSADAFLARLDESVARLEAKQAQKALAATKT